MIENTFALHTLGCKLNFSESSSLARQLKEAGYVQKEFSENAQLYLINTCSVTDNADKECKQIIRKINQQNPDAYIVVVGCYAQLKPQEIANIKGVDMVLGAAEKFNIITHLQKLNSKGNPQIHSCEIDSVEDFVSAFSYQDRTRAFLKLQDGCNYNCSYCTIPLARGKSRSDSIENIMQHIETLFKKDIKEIVLTGVNIGDYENGDYKFIDVVQSIDKLNHATRFRISSIEPNLLTDEIINIVSTSKNFMPHFHIPLQSGSNKILGLMRRRYQRELYADKVKNIKKMMPHAAIGVDVIVGFPDESELDFMDTFNFLHDLDVSYFHVFTYSERVDTLATSQQNKVPIVVRKQRNKILRNLSIKKANHFYEQHLNQSRPVLFENKQSDNTIVGYTDNYIKIKTYYKPEMENKIIDWNII